MDVFPDDPGILNSKNNISQIQMDDRSLQLQKAKVSLYGRASQIELWRGLLPIGNAIFWLFVLSGEGSLAAWPVLFGFALPLVDTYFLAPWERRNKQLAARVQEEFDCRLFLLPWNELLAGERVGQEKLAEEVTRFEKQGYDAQDLSNWYSFDLSDLPISAGRVICQRSNTWWDSRLRKMYGRLLLGLTLTSALITIAYASLGGLDLDQYVVGMMAPLVPFGVWTLKEIQSQWMAATEGERLLRMADEIWIALLNEPKRKQVELESRQLQDLIFKRRVSSPVNPRWLYRRRRNEFENLMIQGGEKLADDFRRMHAPKARQKP